MNINRNQKTRDRIIGEESFDRPTYSGGMRRFRGLTTDQIDALDQGDFIDWKDAQNSSPTIEEFYSFMKCYPGMTAHGYVISGERSDCRVSIEGIEYYGKVSKQLMIDFIGEFRFADEFTVKDDYLNCWWS